MFRRLLLAMALVAGMERLMQTGLAGDCDVDCDTTLRQGRVFQSDSSLVIFGSGSAKLTRVWVPLLIDDGGALLNNSVVRIVDGRIAGGTTTYNAIPYAVICFGTADLYDQNGNYTSNDIVVYESAAFSDTVGRMLGDGKLVWRANYAGAAQNNLEWAQYSPGQQTPIPEPAGGTGILFGPGIDNANDNAYLGTPGAVEHGSRFYVGVTGFGPSGQTIPTGCDIYDYDPAGGPLDVRLPAYVYTQAGAEAFANANGVPIPAGNGRQTQPVLARVNGVYYVVFGVNDTAQGGSARPALLVVDAFEDNDAYAGAVPVFPPAGFRFVDHKATGGGSNVYENAHFDINSSGQLVALTESIEPSNDPDHPPTYRVVLYQPIIAGGRITGFAPPTIIADAGPLDVNPSDGLVGPFYIVDSQGNFRQWISALSGVGINNRGNIAFVGLYDTGEPFDPDDPNSPTRWDDAAYFYDAGTGTLHQVLRENDVIAFNGTALAIGPLAREDSDAFMAAGLADDADVLAVNFRANRDLPEGFSRGVAVVAVGHAGDVDFDGDVDLADLAALLAVYGAQFGTPSYDSQADFDLDGDIDLSDLSVLLANYGS